MGSRLAVEIPVLAYHSQHIAGNTYGTNRVRLSLRFVADCGPPIGLSRNLDHPRQPQPPPWFSPSCSYSVAWAAFFFPLRLTRVRWDT